MRCPNCGSPLREDAKFCGKCGHQIRQVQPRRNPSDNVNVPKRQTAQPQNRSGKYSAAQATHKTKKKENGGVWVVGLLIALIVALLCVIMFVIRPMLKSAKETVETPKHSVQEYNTTDDKKEDKDDSGFFGLGGSKQIIYVVDGKSTYYPSDEGLSNVQTYEFSEDGFPLVYHSASTWYYAYDDEGITDEMINFNNETKNLSESERNEQGEKYKKELNKILKEFGINPDDDIVYNIIGTTGDLVTTNFGGTVNSVMKYNSRGKITERKTYWSGELFSTQTTSYIADQKPLSYETRNENSGVTSRIAYTYEAGEDPVSAEISTIENNTMTVTGYSYYTYDNNGNMSSSKDSDGSYSEYTYDQNGIILKTDSTDGVDIEYTYHYKKIEVDPDDVELLCNIYDHIGITYVLGGDGVSVTNTLNEETMAIATATPIEWEGSYTLSMIQEDPGLYIRYDDGSFDKYYTGNVFTWDMNAMTYGADYRPQDLVMSDSLASSNSSNLEKGQLVLVWPYENRVIEGLYAVEESGYSLFRTDDDGDLEGLMSTSENRFYRWNEGSVFYWSNPVEYKTINGVSKDDYSGFPSAEGRDFVSFVPNETYTIGVVEGTALIEKEYRTNYMYYLHTEETSPYTLTPTTDGYAIFDFTNTAPGRYVFTISRWDDKADARRAVTTLIEIH